MPQGGGLQSVITESVSGGKLSCLDYDRTQTEEILARMLILLSLR